MHEWIKRWGRGIWIIAKHFDSRKLTKDGQERRRIGVMKSKRVLGQDWRKRDTAC